MPDKKDGDPPGKDESDLPSAEQIKKYVVRINKSASRRLQQKFEREFSVQSHNAELGYAHLLGLKDHYKHKSYWSVFLMFLMAIMILFQCFLLYMAGAGHWDFSKYSWLLPALLAQNLAQVVGLAIFVVKALFRDITTSKTASEN